jgi:hypothetical protein
MDEKQKKTRKKEKKLSLLYVLGGGILKEDFIVKHTRMIVLIVILMFFFIGNRYTCMQKLREIDRLQEQTRTSLQTVLTPEQMDKLDKKMREKNSKNNTQKK